jgi:hypothetical protein
MTDNIFACNSFSIKRITTIEEVRAFARYQVEGLKLNFHPDDDFSNYTVAGLNRSLTVQEVETGNSLMDECFSVCEENHLDVYEVMGCYLLDYIAS